MRYLRKIEGVALQNCVLYKSLSDMAVLDNSTHISLRETTGPGASDIDPVVLVVDKRGAERRSQVTSAVESQELFERDYEQRYGTALQLYYVLSEINLTNFQFTIAFMMMMTRLSQKHLSTRTIPLWAVSTLFVCPRLTLCLP